MCIPTQRSLTSTHCCPGLSLDVEHTDIRHDNEIWLVGAPKRVVHALCSRGETTVTYQLRIAESTYCVEVSGRRNVALCLEFRPMPCDQI